MAVTAKTTGRTIEFLDYLLSKDEFFARSYAHYDSKKIGGPILLSVRFTGLVEMNPINILNDLAAGAITREVAIERLISIGASREDAEFHADLVTGQSRGDVIVVAD